jgi:MoxR-like ATPase
MTTIAIDPHHLPSELDLPEPLKGKYLLPEEAKTALQLARVRPRPLLVVGEAGVGKSQLAQALAEHWQVPCLKFVVQSTTEAEELMWRFDAVQRLAEAQVLGASGCQPDDVADKLKLQRFVQPGVLWWASNWADAVKHVQDHGVQNAAQPESPKDWTPDKGCVVLIDEIDKATADVPNNLLDVLDTGCITLPTGERVERQGTPPLIVITSNGDRDLPAPFLRRCYVLHLDFPLNNEINWLKERARAHFTKRQLVDKVIEAAAEQILKDRASAGNTHYKPGVSEYLDLLYAVKDLAKTKDGQINKLTELGQFVLKRNLRS